jgi:hypothetical protein
MKAVSILLSSWLSGPLSSDTIYSSSGRARPL